MTRIWFPWIGLCTILCLTSPAWSVEASVHANEAIYQKRCSFCHQPKSPQALPDLKAWTHLLYTSACPEVTVKLTEAERRAIKAYLEQALQKFPKSSTQP